MNRGIKNSKLPRESRIPFFQAGKSSVLFSACLFLLLVLWTFQFLGLEIADFLRGFSNTGVFAAKLFPPDFGSIQVIIQLSLETLVMATVGTVIGMVLGLTLAYLSALGSGAFGIVPGAANFLIVFFRSIPDLVFAVLLVALFGIGPAAGAIALGLGSIGMVGRISAQAIEDSLPGPREAISSTGASKLQGFFGATVPQISQALVGLFLYRLDINFRSATLMGLVGAGGIGLLLKMTLGVLDYRGAMGVVTVIFFLIFLLESLSVFLRFEISRSTKNRRGQILTPFKLSSLMLLAVTTFGLVEYFGQFWEALSRSDFFFEMLSGLLIPDFISNSDILFNGAVESLAIAVQGTFWGLFVGLPVGFLAAKKQSFGNIAFVLARSFLVLKRGFPTLVIALLFVSAIGLGPLAGILAMAIGTGGALAKFIADSLEEGSVQPVKALESNGASKFQAFFAGTLPQVSPSLLGHILYSFDMNVRYATVLGIVGGGGIGVVILTSVRIMDFGTTSAALVIILFTLLVIEKISSSLRLKLN